MQEERLDLEGLRRRLLQRRKELQARLEALAEDAGRSGQALAKDFEEQAIELEDSEVQDALGRSASEELACIERALARMERDEYDVCAVCGGEIPLPRLAAVPYTDRCVSCAERSSG